MTASGAVFSFGTEQFNRIFPFYLVINNECVISSFGSSIAKLHPIKQGHLFSEYFELKLPVIEQLSFDSLKGLEEQVVLINIKSSATQTLRGQFEYLRDQDQLLFIGTPAFHSMEEVVQKNLTLNDYAKHDSLISQLSNLKAQELASNNIKGLLDTVSEQKDAIKNSERFIQQQKELELQLKETANRLSFLIKNLDSGIVVESADQKIILVNDKFCRFLGIAQTPEQLTGLNYTFINKQSRHLYKHPDVAIARIDEILEQKQSVINELIQLRDGRYFKRDYVPITLILAE